MKITVLHGDDSAAINERKNKITDALRKRGWTVTNLADGNTSFGESLKAGSLFDEEQLYVHTEPTKVTKAELKWLKENADSLASNLLFASNKPLPKGFLSSLPNEANVEQFDLPKVLFQFLEAIYPGNKAAIALLTELLETEAAEFVLAMLARHLRDLYWVKIGGDNMKLPDWRKNKLTYQANRYEDSQLKNMIAKLAKLDVQAKTSGTDLRTSLELFIIRATNIQ